MSERKPSLQDVVTTSRRFYLERSRDPSGVSGLGIVADGAEPMNFNPFLLRRRVRELD